MLVTVSPLERWIAQVIDDPFSWESAVQALAPLLVRDRGLQQELAQIASQLDGLRSAEEAANEDSPHDFVAATLAYALLRPGNLPAGLEALSYSLAAAGGEIDRRLYAIVIQIGESLQSQIQAAEPDDRAFFWTKLGTAYGQVPQGPRSVRQKQALDCYQRGLGTLPAEPEFLVRRCNFLLNRGAIYKELLVGDRAENLHLARHSQEEALCHLDQAERQQLISVEESRDLRGDLLANLGNCWRDTPDSPHQPHGENLRRATAYYQQALSLYSDQRKRAETLHNLAQALRHVPDDPTALSQAVANYREAVALLQRYPPGESLATTLLMLGTALLESEQRGNSQRYDEARHCMQSAELLFQQLGLARLRIYALFNRGVLELADCQWHAAAKCLGESARLVERDFPQAGAEDDDRTGWLALHTQVYEALLWALARSGENLPATPRAKLAAQAAEWAELSRARNLAFWLRTDASSGEQPLTAHDLASLAARSQACLLTLRMTPWGGVAVAVASEGRFLLRHFESLPAADLQATWRDWGKNYWKFIQPQRQPASLEERLAAIDAWNRQIEATLAWVGQTLGRPLHAFLRECWGSEPAADHPQAVVVFAGQGFNLLPLHALQWREGDRIVHADDEYLYAYLPSARLLGKMLDRPQSAGGSLAPLLVKNPTGDPNLRRFEDLCDRLAELWPDALVRGAVGMFGCKPASRQRLLGDEHQPGELAAARRVLFATHGHCDFRDPWDQSYLMLIAPTGSEDAELLTLADLIELDLSGIELVTLCACESGIPDPNDPTGEQLGLPTGLLYAGVRGVAASLWEVAAGPASLLFQHFFQNLHRMDEPIVAGQPADPWRTARLFRASRRWLAKAGREELALAVEQLAGEAGYLPPGERPFELPFYWASFGWYGIG